MAASRESVLASGMVSNAVLLAESSWIAINEALNLPAVRGMPESMAEVVAESIDDCASELD